MNANTMDQSTTSSHDQPQSYESAACSAAAASQHESNPLCPPNNPSTNLLPSPSSHDAQQSQLYTENQSQQHRQQQHHQNPPTQPMQPSSVQTYPHQIHALGGPTATAPFLRDFSLVAEAARRAQVSVVTRDLEGISL